MAAATLAVGALTLAACSSSPAAVKKPKTTTTVVPVTAQPQLCPLTGQPAPGGVIPQRPALAIKVDNYSAARPQSGLDRADIIFEEPVEGGITRYVAVFQCQNAPMVGPIRSARNIDIGILTQFGQPLLVHVGGINPVIANIAASPLINLDLGNYGLVIVHPPGRYAPFDTYASTTALWGLRADDQTVPAPIFTYSSTVPTGTAVTSVVIPFSGDAPVVWLYNPTNKLFMRYYGPEPDLLNNGHQNAAANVIVQTVDVTYGPWLENAEGGLEVQAQLSGTNGPLKVFRDGVEIDGIWQRSGAADPTQLLDSGGHPIALQPGPTWVELVPSTVNVTVATATPPPSPGSSTTASG
ncbi:MAG TPA: DUF3048 domain-containing protein [Acidimicrobiales bacterium]|nr:DUF3048 domain-containing protein [Acidimicrobiales bacterium]